MVKAQGLVGCEIVFVIRWYRTIGLNLLIKTVVNAARYICNSNFKTLLNGQHRD